MRETYDSVAEWLEHATLPPGHEPHPKFSKETVSEIAKDSKIETPERIDALWVRLTEAAHDYDRNKPIRFNELPKSTRKLAKTLTERLYGVRDLLDRTKYGQELRLIESIEDQAMLRSVATVEAGTESACSHPAVPEVALEPSLSHDVSIPRFRRDIDAMLAVLEKVEGQTSAAKRGRRENFALHTFLSRIMALWTGYLGREISVDHNERTAYSDAAVFAARCAHTLDNVKEAPVIVALRSMRTDIKGIVK
jgi:hypothetical protein